MSSINCAAYGAGDGQQTGNLLNLSVLILHRNGLKTLSAEITELRNLQSIYLGGRPALDFNDVVEKLAKLPKLEGVGLDDNQMREVPRGIDRLRACKRLGLSSNGLRNCRRRWHEWKDSKRWTFTTTNFAGWGFVSTSSNA